MRLSAIPSISLRAAAASCEFGLAFAIGALWVVKRQQQQSSFERLLSQLPSVSNGGDWIDRRSPSFYLS
jgi:hypothetical protein